MHIYIIEQHKNEEGSVVPYQHRDALIKKYQEQITKHNSKVEQQEKQLSNISFFQDAPICFADSGFDLFVPPAPEHKESEKEKGWVNFNGSWFIKPHATVKIPLGIKLVKTSHPMFRGQKGSRITFPYCVHPRSSIYKTPLRLANCTGIIDAGYRGELMAVFDNIKDESYELKPFTRLVQACAPDLRPFSVTIVDSDFNTTTRGDGGLGSTGR